MGYALFANNKVALTGRVNSISLQQTQRSNEQNTLATQQLSLQQELSTMQASQSIELSELYQLLSKISANGSFSDEFLLQSGVVATEKDPNDPNKVIIKENKDNEGKGTGEVYLHTSSGKDKLDLSDTDTLVQRGAEIDLSADALQLMGQILDDYNDYKRTGSTSDSGTGSLASAARDAINAKIKEKQSGFDAELADINNEIYLVGVKENAIEMEVKRLDTALSSAQKELDAVIDAEGDAIDKATPKFSSNG